MGGAVRIRRHPCPSTVTAGDRPLVGDERGQWLRGDVAGILCAQYLGAQEVVTTVSCNTAAELCGTFDSVVRTRIGSPYVIEAMESLVKAGGRKSSDSNRTVVSGRFGT